MKCTSLPLLRREFIIGLAGSTAWPLVAKGQPPDRMRRVGVLMNTVSDEQEAQARIAAFSQALKESGWEVGRNVRIDTRWSGGDVARLRRDATELVGLNPDIVLAGVGPTTEALRAASRTVPIVFAQSVDPVGSGQVASLARPGGNATGFLQFEYGLSGKWPELLKEVPLESRAWAFYGMVAPRESDNGPSSRPWRHRWAWS